MCSVPSLPIVLYLARLFLTKTARSLMANGQRGGIEKDSVVANFLILSYNSSRATDKKNEERQDKRCLGQDANRVPWWPRFN
jgi:hypothetical protein